MKILLVDDEQDILEVLTFTLESEVEADLLTAKSGNEAIEIIKAQNLDLIICDYNMDDGSGGDVYKYLLDNQIQVPYVMCSSDSPEDHNIFQDRRYLIGNILKPGIFEGIGFILGRYEEYCQNINKNSMEISRVATDFVSISLELLKTTGVLPADVFIKVSEEKMLKVYSKEDQFTQEDEAKYIARNIQTLLVKKEDVKLFVECICSQVIKILEKSDNISQEEKILNVHSVILDTVRSMGMSEQVVRATEKSVEFALSVFKKNKEFRSISKHIFGHKGEFLTKHSVALAYVSCGILAKLPWDSFESRNKLVIASFYHDATLKSSSFNEDKSDVEALKEIPNFNEHPIEASDLVKHFKEMPPDVDRIIIEHHERPDGSGFPKGISGSQISALGSIFIVAHLIVECIFDKRDEISKEDILACVREKISETGNFKKVINAFMEANLFG